MTETPDPSLFSINERTGEYRIRFNVRGWIEMTINADSEDDARAKAEAMAEDEDFGLELDEAGDVDISYVCKEPTLYRVLRDGKYFQVSRLQPGDLPRAPREDGF